MLLTKSCIGGWLTCWLPGLLGGVGVGPTTPLTLAPPAMTGERAKPPTMAQALYSPLAQGIHLRTRVGYQTLTRHSFTFYLSTFVLFPPTHVSEVWRTY